MEGWRRKITTPIVIGRYVSAIGHERGVAQQPVELRRPAGLGRCSNGHASH